ncbi:MAG: aspartate carbamoyltransferase catalytic subunit [Desulfobacterota bacterium]|nr:aspartate carbamoyltransferase catalytic subunit [Thermodesulfobacteriota bacterium]
MELRQKHLLGIEDLSAGEISLILETAASMKEVSSRDIKKVPTLRGKTVINLFFEPSTRTRTSFEIAGKRLSADVINISSSSSSVVKGETLEDTGKNLQAMNPDLIIIRHPNPGAPHLLARTLEASIINAGDGAHEHPTQALLDAYTMQEKMGQIEGLSVAIIGDITHSRVARSNILLLRKMGATVRVCGPRTMVPLFIEQMGVSYVPDLREAVKDVNVIMMLRIQLERQQQRLFPSIREYARYFGLTRSVLDAARNDVLIMHPGPINRGVEISPDVLDTPSTIILDQVANGVAVRMALMYLLIGR